MDKSVIELEGTWEEILARIPDFNGKRLHITVQAVEEKVSAGPISVDSALDSIWKQVPDASWDRFPADFGENMDHYLFGSTKQK
jgi:hypothetical protein